MKNVRSEKIINGLKCCASMGFEGCKKCPYNESVPTIPHCTRLLLSETIELLEEQDTVISSLRVILNTLYGKEATEELK